MDEGVLDPTSTVMAIFPSPMMYAGPTEVCLSVCLSAHSSSSVFRLSTVTILLPSSDVKRGQNLEAEADARATRPRPISGG